MNPVVGLGRSAALQSPQGGALRAKRRPRPTTTAPPRGWAVPARRDFVLGNPSARDSRAPVSTSAASLLWGFLSRLLPPPASRTPGARRALSTSTSALGSESPSSPLPTRTPSRGFLPARGAGFAVPLDRSGFHAAPPSRCSAPARSPAGRSSPVPSPQDPAGDSPPRPPQPARNARCAADQPVRSGEDGS